MYLHMCIFRLESDAGRLHALKQKCFLILLKKVVARHRRTKPYTFSIFVFILGSRLRRWSRSGAEGAKNF